MNFNPSQKTKKLMVFYGGLTSIFGLANLFFHEIISYFLLTVGLAPLLFLLMLYQKEKQAKIEHKPVVKAQRTEAKHV